MQYYTSFKINKALVNDGFINYAFASTRMCLAQRDFNSWPFIGEKFDNNFCRNFLLYT